MSEIDRLLPEHSGVSNAEAPSIRSAATSQAHPKHP